LCAFVAVALCVIVSRRREPDARRPFKTPLVWLVAPLTIIGCIYLFANLSRLTIMFFFAWNAVGLIAYWLYGAPRAQRARTAAGG
jgi:basic amino acid/polyamine antiporter, APA family